MIAGRREEILWLVVLAAASACAYWLYRTDMRTGKVELQSPVVSVVAEEGQRYVYARFKIRNNGARPVEVTDFKAMCDCYEVDLPVKVGPGGVESVLVKLDQKKMSFPAEREIKFLTNPLVNGLVGTIYIEPSPSLAASGAASAAHIESQESEGVVREKGSESGRQSVLVRGDEGE